MGLLQKAEFLEWSQGREHLETYNSSEECQVCSLNNPERQFLLDNAV